MHPWSSYYSTRIYADCAEKLRLLGLPIEIPISASAYTPGWTEIISKYMAFVYIGIDFKIDAEMTQFHLKFPKLRAEFGGLFSIDTGFNKVHLLLIGSEKYITIKNIQLMQDIIIPSKPKKSKQEPKKQDVECFFLPNNSSVALKDFWLVNILNAEETIFCNFDINKLRETNQLVLKAN
jgi:hypothetical protein